MDSFSSAHRENHAHSCLTQLVDCTVGCGQVRPHTQPYTHLAQDIQAGSTCWVFGLALHCVTVILQNMVVCRRPCNAEIHTSTQPTPISHDCLTACLTVHICTHLLSTCQTKLHLIPDQQSVGNHCCKVSLTAECPYGLLGLYTCWVLT